MVVMASLNQTPNSLKPNIFDWNDPGSYVPPTVEREYLRYRRGTPLEQPKSRLDILKNKWLIVGAAGTAALALTAVGFGKDTLGEGFRTIFPDDSPPIEQPVNGFVNNHG